MSDPTKCNECGSSDLYWFAVNVNKTGVAEGRLRTHEPTCRFVLGCHDCSETLKAVDADRIAERMNTEQSQLAALREELATYKLAVERLGGTVEKVAIVAKFNKDAGEDLQQRLADAERRNAPVLNIEEAAKTLACCMDYPWEHMPENGRALMRKHAKDVVDAALNPNPEAASHD